MFTTQNRFNKPRTSTASHMQNLAASTLEIVEQARCEAVTTIGPCCAEMRQSLLRPLKCLKETTVSVQAPPWKRALAAVLLVPGSIGTLSVLIVLIAIFSLLAILAIVLLATFILFGYTIATLRDLVFRLITKLIEIVGFSWDILVTMIHSPRPKD